MSSFRTFYSSKKIFKCFLGSAIFTKYCHISEKSFKMYLRKALVYKSTFFSSIWQLKIMVLCEIVWVIKIEVASRITDNPFPLSFRFSLTILHYYLDLISSSGHPICAESVPSGKRQAIWAAVRRWVICLLANKQLSGRWGDAVLIFFAFFFASRQKRMWGLGQSPKNQWIMDNE
jgi:hypothetical protein